MKLFCVAALGALLCLGAGCAIKSVPPPEKESVPPVVPQPPQPSITEILDKQYKQWKGVPYKFGGTSRSGVDCSGFVQAVFRDGFDVSLPRTSIEQSRMGRSVPREDIRPGDLLFFSDRKTDHIGVALGRNLFLQASSSAGVVVSDLDRYWKSRLARISRVLDDDWYTALVSVLMVN